jgi:acetylornithine deacetylase/succinyl-diaminopimelate desuccinylase-like protein
VAQVTISTTPEGSPTVDSLGFFYPQQVGLDSRPVDERELHMNQIDQVLEHIDQAFLAKVQDRLYKLLEIPSISTEPEHADDCLKAANYLGKELAELGFTATRKPSESVVGLVRETTGRPVVVAHHTGPENAPHLIYYGHYDVQPARQDDVQPGHQDRWNSPPFEPTLSNRPHPNSIVARGVADDKGQTWMWLSAIRAWHERIGTMPCPMTVLIEATKRQIRSTSTNLSKLTATS